jgi:isocitrate dehydrogenase
MPFASSASSSPPFSASHPLPVTMAVGDGVGPEIMAATVKLLDAVKAPIRTEWITVGEAVYSKGVTSGIDDDGWASINRTNLLLKAPITTPLGKGVKSLNVTMRKTLGLFANVRPVFAYSPFVPALHKKIDLVIIRENEEDLYAGIEHRHTAEVMQCLKLITVPGCERILRYAFEYCVSHGRKKLTCVTKSNIMKLTDGIFQTLFLDMAKQYPQIQCEHQIVDIATARVAAKPQNYDVIVTSNLYGDIISDVAAEVAGSVGLAGSANIGTSSAMFEAIHGSAPDIAGKDIANPAGLFNATVMMLNYKGLRNEASLVHNALLKTLEDGVHTADIYGELTKKKVGTKAFTAEVIARLGEKPKVLIAVDYAAQADGQKARKLVEAPKTALPERPVKPTPVKAFVGTDLFFDWDPPAAKRDPNILAALLQKQAGDKFKLNMVSNRGVIVWPSGHPNTYKVDHWRCRFELVKGPMADAHAGGAEVIALMSRMQAAGLSVIKVENLYNFDGEAGYSKGQGQ